MTDLTILGIDEAGRGSVLGSMIICGVCFSDVHLNYLLDIGVKDSKKISAKKRKELAILIKTACYSYKVSEITAKEIDLREEKRITLNRLEELKMAEIINELTPDIIYIDAADVNAKRFGESIRRQLNYNPTRIVSKHKADDIYPIVSAASIIAKDKRDALIDELKKKFGDFGSGYPSDERTIDFLKQWIKKNKKIPEFARKTWETTRRIISEELTYKKITNYLK